MGIRIDRTLKNWRWWVASPIYLFIGLPLAVVVYAADRLTAILVWLSDYFVPLNSWVKRGRAR